MKFAILQKSCLNCGSCKNNYTAVVKNSAVILKYCFVVLNSCDGFSLYSGINAYIPEHFKSHFTEKIWLRNYSQ
jgi:hypothetical protein